MPYEILNEDKTNVGECLFFEQLRDKNRGSGGLPLEKFLEATPLRASENVLLNPPPDAQIVSQFRAFSDNKPFFIGWQLLPCPLGYATAFECVLGVPHIPICCISTEWIVDFSYKIEIWIDMKINIKVWILVY